MRDEGLDDEPSCKNCRFYVPLEVEDMEVESSCGDCRRFPPKRYDAANSVFPLVLEDCWCGEWDAIM